MYGAYDKFERFYVLPETAIAIEAAAGVKATWNFNGPACITRVGVQIVVAIDYDTLVTKCKIAFKKYVTFGSATGAVTLATFEVDNTLAAGTVLYVDVPNLAATLKGNVKSGEQVVCEVTVQGAGGTELGDYQPYICYHPRAETDANQAYLVAVTDLT